MPMSGLQHDATRLEFCWGSFDAVVCVYVLTRPAPAWVPSCVAKQVTIPVRNREARVTEPHVA
jgi:hypothetical protein